MNPPLFHADEFQEVFQQPKLSPGKVVARQVMTLAGMTAAHQDAIYSLLNASED